VSATIWCRPKTDGLLLALTGVSKGKLLRDGNPQPALDVSGAYDLIVEKPAGEEFSQEHLPMRGLVCESRAGSGLLLVRAPVDERPLCVWLRDPEGKVERGQVTSEASVGKSWCR
jgi:hypothetical protein